MNFYFAPLEGITRYIFRNAYEKYYGGIDKYFAPFISPTDNCFLTPKNIRELCPEHNVGINLIPQILTNNSVAFKGAAKELLDMGYREINLNLGCPSGTVCAKRKGAGLLGGLYELERLLDSIYEWSALENVKISIKTRLGRYEPEEFYDILDIYNNYPISELIIHPRVEKDYYKGEPRLDFFCYAALQSKNPIIFNGNLFTKEDIDNILNMKYDDRIANVEKNEINILKEENENKITINNSLMLGRGLLYNPELIEQYNKNINNENKEYIIKNKKYIIENKEFKNKEWLEKSDKSYNLDNNRQDNFNYKRFWDFHNEIYHNYQEIMSPDKNVLFHMKELWTYWKNIFPDKERAIKNILKSKNYVEYEIALREL